MRTTALLLAAVVAAVFVAESFSAPTPNDGTLSIKASKSSSNTKSASASSDSSSEEMKANTCSGDYSKKASKKSSKSASSSADQSSETLEIYKAGASSCGDALPARKCGETDEVYYKRIFPVNECDQSTWKCFYAKVFKQYKGESKEDYVKRVDIIFGTIYKKLDCRTSIKQIEYIKNYISIKYAKTSETDEAWFVRCITKTTETEQQYTEKIEVLKTVITTVNWKIVKIDAKSKTGYTLVKETSTSTGKSIDDSSSCKKTITEEEAKTTYAQQSCEDITTYYKRIVTKISTLKTDKEYVEYVSVIQKVYKDLPLWYSDEFLSIIKIYYTAKYGKQSCESDETYIVRVLTKETYESNEQWAKREGVLIQLFPTLSCWSDVKYYEKYLKCIYSVIYKKETTEDLTKYYKRILIKYEKETDLCYGSRILLIKKTFISEAVWYETQYFEIIKSCYTVIYAKQAKETDEQLYVRIVTKIDQETDEQCAKRAELVRRCYPNYDLFSQEKYYEKYTKTIYTFVFKKLDCEDENAYFKRITEQTTTETLIVYIARLNLIEKTYPKLTLYSDYKYIELIKTWYTKKYSKGSCEKTEDYYKRLVAKESCDTSDEAYANRIYIIHTLTTSEEVWYEEKYYETLTKTYYITYYKKGEKEDCVAWLTKVIKPLPKETNECAVKRIKLINKSKTGCKCWTSDNLSKLECNKSFTKEYLSLLKKTFCSSNSFEMKKSSKSSKSNTASASSDSSEVSVKNC